MAYTITEAKINEIKIFFQELMNRQNTGKFGFLINNGWSKVLKKTQEVAKAKSKWDTDKYKNFEAYLAELGDKNQTLDNAEADKRIKEVKEVFSEAVIQYYHEWAGRCLKSGMRGMVKYIASTVDYYIRYNGDTDEQAVLVGVDQKKLTDEITSWTLTNPKLKTADAEWSNASMYFTDELVAEWKKPGFTAAQAKEWMDIIPVSAQPIEVYNVDFYAWLTNEKKQPGGAAVDAAWVLNHGDFAALKNEFDAFVLAGGKSSSSITWSGSGPRKTTHTSQKVLTSPTYLTGLGGKTVFDLMPIDIEAEANYLSNMDTWEKLGAVNKTEKKAIEDYVKVQYEDVEKLDPWAVGSWDRELGFPAPSTPDDPKTQFTTDLRKAWFTRAEIEWLKNEVKDEAERKVWLDNQKAKITIAPAKDNTLSKAKTVSIDLGNGKGPQTINNDGVGNVSFVFPHNYNAQPRHVYQIEGEGILLKDKNFDANTRIVNPFIVNN